jgi:hypothetical protein
MKIKHKILGLLCGEHYEREQIGDGQLFEGESADYLQ